MPDSSNDFIQCGNGECGYIFDGDDIDTNSGKHKPCPRCGSTQRNFFNSVHDSIVTHEFLGLRAKKPDSKHKGNRPDYESEIGIRIGKNGELVFVRQIKDREHPDSDDSYQEFVIDVQKNKIIVDKHEILSEHNNSLKYKRN